MDPHFDQLHVSRRTRMEHLFISYGLECVLQHLSWIYRLHGPLLLLKGVICYTPRDPKHPI